MHQMLIAYPHIIFEGILLVLSIALGIAYFRAPFGAHQSFKIFATAVVLLQVMYVGLLAWGQYAVWQGSPFTRTFLHHPLDPEVPMPWILSLVPSVWGSDLGYFWFYVVGRFVVPMLALFGVTLLFVALLAFWRRVHPLKFREGDLSVIATSLIVAGWPGALVLIPFALLGTVVRAIIARSDEEGGRVYLPPVFVVGAPIILAIVTLFPSIFNIPGFLRL